MRLLPDYPNDCLRSYRFRSFHPDSENQMPQRAYPTHHAGLLSIIPHVFLRFLFSVRRIRVSDFWWIIQSKCILNNESSTIDFILNSYACFESLVAIVGLPPAKVKASIKIPY